MIHSDTFLGSASTHLQQNTRWYCAM